MSIWWTLFELIFSLFQSFLFLGFARLFLGCNLKKIKDVVSYILASVIFFLVIVVSNYITAFEGVAVLVFTIPIFIYALCFLEGTITKKIIAAIIPILANVICGSVMFNIISSLFSTTVGDVISVSGMPRLMFVIITNILITYLLLIILNLAQKESFKFGKTETILSASVLILTVVIFAVIDLAIIDMELSLNQSILILCALMGLIVINIVIFYFVVQISKSNEIRVQNSILQQKLMYQEQYTQGIKQQYQSTLHMQHDIKHNFSVLNILIGEERYEDAAKLLDEYTNMNMLVRPWINTENIVLNAIVNMKFSYANSIGIKTFCTLPHKFDLLCESDLCILIGNMLDNAIEHCEKYKERDNEIYVEINYDGMRSIIMVKNTLHEAIEMEKGVIKTRKKDKNKHGFGMKSINDIAEKYNAILDCYENNGMFHVKLIL